ncbi:MAG: HlyD family efflux transporter periplasmic adaptor subunit [Magnetococcus sp. DMHC-6]
MHLHIKKANRRKLSKCWRTSIGILIVGIPLFGNANSEGSHIEQPEIRAYLVSRTHTTLSSHLDAEIQRLNVQEGDSVTMGKTLVVFDCKILAAQRHKAQTMLLAAKNKNKVVQRLAELHSVGTLEAEASQAEQAQAEADLAFQETRMRGCEIQAPFTGRIASLTVRERQYVMTGQSLMKIIDHRHLEMEMIVPSRWLAWLQPKTPFSIHIDETGKNYPAQVLRLGAEADPVSQSIKIIGGITIEHAELVPGMSGVASFKQPDADIKHLSFVTTDKKSPKTPILAPRQQTHADAR